jgi:hypothetical protein
MYRYRWKALLKLYSVMNTSTYQQAQKATRNNEGHSNWRCLFLSYKFYMFRIGWQNCFLAIKINRTGQSGLFPHKNYITRIKCPKKVSPLRVKTQRVRILLSEHTSDWVTRIIKPNSKNKKWYIEVEPTCLCNIVFNVPNVMCNFSLPRHSRENSIIRTQYE